MNMNQVQLNIILGPMFSGKSTEGIRQIRRYGKHFGSNKILSIKYSKDTRYTNEEKVSTHDKTTIEAISCAQLEDLGTKWMKYRAIFIDEGQFFKDIVPFTLNALKHGVNVIIAALDGDFKAQPFPNKLFDLIPYSDRTIKLPALCVCGNDAIFTQRITTETAQEVIGGADKYESRCRTCYRDPNDEKNTDEFLSKSI